MKNSGLSESERKLLEALDAAVFQERAAVASSLGLLVRVDEEEEYRKEGCASLFELCTEKLGLEPEEASARVAMVDIAKMHPTVRDALVNDRLVADDWKKPLARMSPGRAVARVFVELCNAIPGAAIVDDDDEGLASTRSPALTLVTGGLADVCAAPGSARRLRP